MQCIVRRHAYRSFVKNNITCVVQGRGLNCFWTSSRASQQVRIPAGKKEEEEEEPD
jgi:hypothetical protein